MRYIGFMKNNIQPLKRLSLREEVYQTLKHNIVMLEFQPEQKLQDKELAEQFGVSRTPVREALKGSKMKALYKRHLVLLQKWLH